MKNFFFLWILLLVISSIRESSSQSTQYVVLTNYFNESCIGEIQYQVGYQTNKCIPGSTSGSYYVKCENNTIISKYFNDNQCNNFTNENYMSFVKCSNYQSFTCEDATDYHDLILMTSIIETSYSDTDVNLSLPISFYAFIYGVCMTNQVGIDDYASEVFRTLSNGDSISSSDYGLYYECFNTSQNNENYKNGKTQFETSYNSEQSISSQSFQYGCLSGEPVVIASNSGNCMLTNSSEPYYLPVVPAPSLQPSLQPSSQSSSQPSLQSSTSEPSAVPTLHPTLLQQTDMTVTQIINGCSYSSYLQNTSTFILTIKQTIVLSMNNVSSGIITLDNIQNFIVYNDQPQQTRKLLQTPYVTIGYTIQSLTESLLSMQNALMVSVSTGSFNQNLQTTASKNNATALKDASTSISSLQITNTSPTFQPTEALSTVSKSKHTKGALIGGVLGVLLFLIMVVAITFRYLSKKRQRTVTIDISTANPLAHRISVTNSDGTIKNPMVNRITIGATHTTNI